ncbi:MAG TPA: TonB-dependent receptor [Chitinophagales bacterium]|nr:TonB-dependent receptor [Chitinophagales bacterium]
MRPVAICILLLFLFNSSIAQQFTTTIKGKVIDKDSHQPLFGVNVLLLNTNPPKGATTDIEGSFRLENAPVGRQSLKFSYIGYDDLVVSELLLISSRDLVINIEMQEKVSNLKEVEIVAQKDKSRANNDFAPISARSFSAEEMNRYAGTQNDPARMAQSFAGVVTANDENNQIVVRGNSPRGLLWRMEGVEIPNPNHFAGSEGSTGGGVSILSSNMLTNTDFFSGAFAAEYGNALSGVFDVNLRKGNSEKWEFALKLGILGAEAAIEGPFSKKYKGSYLVNYRYSTLELFALTGFDIGGSVTPKYQDLCFNFYFPTNKAGSFTLFGIGGLSSLGNKVKSDTSEWKTISDKSEFAQKQMMGVAGITHLFPFKDNRTYIKTVVSYSYTNNGSTDDTVDYDFNRFETGNEKFIYKTLRAATMLNTKIDARNVVRLGAVYSNIDFRLFRERFSYLNQQVEKQVDFSGNTSMVQAYVQWKHRFTERFQLNSGMHLLFSLLNNKFYPEPRISAEYKATEKQSVSFGLGLHSRIDAISTYVSYNAGIQGGNRNLDFSRAFHAVAGYNFSFYKDFRLKTEVYFQYLFNVPIGADTNGRTFSIVNYDDGFVNIPLKSKGVGYNYGLELTIEKFFSKNYFFMLTTSLFNSKYRAADGRWRNTTYNVNYVLNALGGKEFVVGKKKNNIIGINAKIIWRGGNKVTPVDLPKSIAANETVYQTDKAFSEKLPDYFRIDFGVSFRRNKKKYSWMLSFDAQNIINRNNVAARIYNPETQMIETKTNLGIVPVFSWKVEFGI